MLNYVCKHGGIMSKISMNVSNFIPKEVAIKNVEMNHQEVLNVTKNPEVELFDEPTYAILRDFEFENGIIEVKVFSRLLKDAPDFARGFIGIAFHINQENSEFEGIYIRPTNSKVKDQMRRNRSTQYFSYPNYKFDVLRQTDPIKYESYVDIDIQEWIDFKVIVLNESAELFINNAPQPCLVVTDLKLGKRKGSIALWSEVGTDAYFKDLVVTKF